MKVKLKSQNGLCGNNWSLDHGSCTIANVKMQIYHKAIVFAYGKQHETNARQVDLCNLGKTKPTKLSSFCARVVGCIDCGRWKALERWCHR